MAFQFHILTNLPSVQFPQDNADENSKPNKSFEAKVT